VQVNDSLKVAELWRQSRFVKLMGGPSIFEGLELSGAKAALFEGYMVVTPYALAAQGTIDERSAQIMLHLPKGKLDERTEIRASWMARAVTACRGDRPVRRGSDPLLLYCC
jgi:hypothetical protein